MKTSARPVFWLQILFALLLPALLTTPLKAQLYRHEFTGINPGPTQAQLSTPNSIHPALTSSWAAEQGYFYRYSANGNEALAIHSRNHLYTLSLNVSPCSQVDISRISLLAVSGDGATFQLLVNGEAYGNPFTAGVPGSAITRNKTITALTGKINITLAVTNQADPNRNYTSIDNFTVYGSVTTGTEPASPVTFAQGDSSERCQELQNVMYEVNAGHYRTLLYTLDQKSVDAGLSVNTADGTVYFPPAFSGEVLISATATGCDGGTTSATHTARILPNLPVQDHDLSTVLDSDGYSDLADHCIHIGNLYSPGLADRSVTVQTRWKDHVRYYSLLSEDADTSSFSTGVLTFTQEDFSNYKGVSRLPQSPFDFEGKSFLRLWLYYPGSDVNGRPDQVIDPEDDRIYFDLQTANWRVSFDMTGFGTIILKDADAPLPVKLAAIRAKNTAEGNRIEWTTTEESNFSHFELEKSRDPRAGFTLLASILPHGRQKGGTYSFYDSRSDQLCYYRLKMIDQDGTYEFSRIVSAGADLPEAHLTIYPNPVTENLHIKGTEPISSITLCNRAGFEVFQKHFQGTRTKENIRLPQVQPGLYLVRILTTEGKSVTQKVMIH